MATDFKAPPAIEEENSKRKGRFLPETGIHPKI
jgi:hypothetical protein